MSGPVNNSILYKGQQAMVAKLRGESEGLLGGLRMSFDGSEKVRNESPSDT